MCCQLYQQHHSAWSDRFREKTLGERFSVKKQPFFPIQGESFKRKHEFGESVTLLVKKHPFFPDSMQKALEERMYEYDF